MKTVNRIENYIRKLTNLEPIEISKYLHYSKDIQKILSYKSDIEFYNNDKYNYELIEKLSIIRDSRTILEFAKQMILSWIVEDLTIKRFNDLSNMYKLKLGGTDKERKFQTKNNIKTTPDFILETDTEQYGIEFMCDYSNSWNTYGSIALRNNKLKRLQERKDYLFLLDAGNDSVTIINMDNNFIIDTLNLPQYGGKETSRIYIKENNITFYIFDEYFVNGIQNYFFNKN